VRVSPTFTFVVLALLVPAAATAAVIQGTTRPDRLKGTAKADRIEAVFGATDRVTCGKGVDVVTADLADKVSRDCEFVSRRISADTLATSPGQHQTEVEPSVTGWGSTAVATFQVGRFTDGGAWGNRLGDVDRRRPDLAVGRAAGPDERVQPRGRGAARQRSGGRLRRGAWNVAHRNARAR
jgi:hypothetical protein